MALITNPKTNVTELSGEYKMLSLNSLTITTASDALTLSYANNGISEIQNIIASITTGADANLATLVPSYSGLVVTIVSKNASGEAASDWTSAAINLVIIGK